MYIFVVYNVFSSSMIFAHIKKYLLHILLLLSCSSLFAQQDMQYSQYVFNYLVINPAYAGYKEALNLQAFGRMQWTGVSGAPNIYSIAADAAATRENNVGWGGQIVNETRGATNLFSLFGTYAYRIRLNRRDDRLAIGLSAGVTQWQIDRSKLIYGGNTTYNPGDYVEQLLPEWRPDFRFGIFYSNPFFFAGASVTNLFANFSSAEKVPHLYISAGGLIEVNDNIILKPSFLLREDFNGPANMDINVMGFILKQLWVGASYRQGIYLGYKDTRDPTSAQSTNTISILGELQIIKNLRIGYAYDISLNGWPGTHEFALSYTIERKRLIHSNPRYF